MKINLYGIAYPVTALGPGNRLVVWVCGCRQQCPGCISPEIQQYSSGKEIEIKKLLRHFMWLDYPLEGITISGGESFDQPQALKELLEGLGFQKPSWNIIVYTGYTLMEILADKTGKCSLLKYVDILIDGNYQKNIVSHHPLTGSGNQIIHYLTQRGRSLKARIDSLPRDYANLGLGNAHRHMLIGILNPGVRKEVHEKLHIPGIDHKGGIHA